MASAWAAERDRHGRAAARRAPPATAVPTGTESLLQRDDVGHIEQSVAWGEERFM